MTTVKTMHDRTQSNRCDLETWALTIARRYQAGVLPLSPHTGWNTAWRYLIRDLRNNCPGFSALEYGIALNQAFVRPKGETPG